MSFVKFLIKHASELASIGDALGVAADIAQGDKKDIERIRTASQVAKSGATNIKESIDDVKDLVEMKVTKDDIKEIVAELLPEIVAALLAKMVKSEPKAKGSVKK